MVVTQETLESKVGEYLAEVRRSGRPLIVTDGGRQVLEVRPLPETYSKPAVMADLRFRLFGGEMAESIQEDLIMEPEWREEDDADDSWWIGPSPNT